MKTIVKIEIILLVIVILVAAGMTMYTMGIFDLFKEPVIQAPNPAPTATQPQTLPLEREDPAAKEMPQIADAEPIPEKTVGTISRNITARKYFVYDLRSQEFLQTKGNVDEKLYPASITKLLTSYVLLQYMKPEDTVVVGDALKLVEPDSSLANLREGDTLTVDELIAAMMLPSGNDAAQVAGVACGRVIAGESNMDYEKAVKVFVEEMNRQAESLGMSGSHFMNPDGWHNDEHYTTMADLVKLASKVLAEPQILKYTGMDTKTVELEGHTETWRNTNPLLHSNSKFYVDATIGLKTGYTGKAGSCLITAFFEEDRVLLIGVFGCPAYTNDRNEDITAIYHAIG